MIDLSYIIQDRKRGTMKHKRNIERTNPYSKVTVLLTAPEAYWYDAVKMAEINEEYKVMEHGMDKFSKLNPSAYMKLLD